MQSKLALLSAVLLFLSFLPTSQLTIEISELKNSKGTLLLEFSDSERNVIKEIRQRIENNTCIIRISDLKPGNYSFKYFHDENNNKKMDTNFVGMPKEGFGFSNNAKGTFGPPKHEKTIFDLKGDSVVQCIPIYLKKK